MWHLFVTPALRMVTEEKKTTPGGIWNHNVMVKRHPLDHYATTAAPVTILS